MKRQDDLGVGGSIFMTVVFAAAAIFTYQTDPSGNPLAWIPGIGVIVGIIMTIIAANKASRLFLHKTIPGLDTCTSSS